MFARGQEDGNVARDADGEDVFGILRNPGGVAVAPGREDLVDAGKTPVAQDNACSVGNDTGFFKQFAGGCFEQGFVGGVDRAGDRLPEAGAVGAFDEEDVEVGRMDHDQDGDGDFVQLIILKNKLWLKFT